MKAVSVVVPCYNTAAYLEKCIVQLLQQTIGIDSIEIILVNDASTDEGATWNLIREYEQRFPETILAVTLDQNMRQGGARNIGASYASGEYIMFCDADDWLLEEALDHCYQAAKEYDADVVEFLNTNVKNRDALIEPIRGEQSQLIVVETEEQRREFLLRIDEKMTLGSQRKLCRRSLIREHQIAFAEHLIFEEPSFTLPLRFYEKRHYLLDEVLYVNYLSPQSTVRGNWGEHKWDNPKVWTRLINELGDRGFLQIYFPEIELLFFEWGFGVSIRMAIQKGYVLMKEELLFLTNMVSKMVPNIRKNKYLNEEQRSWRSLMITLLDLEITDESVAVINAILKKYA